MNCQNGIYYADNTQMSGALGQSASIENQKASLDRQVREAALRLCHSTEESADAVVARAEAYIKFING